MEILNFYRQRTENQRDILHFVNVRDATERDDERIGAFLLKVFSLAACKNTPGISLQTGRIQELLNVRSRRMSGLVRIIELGDRIIGSYGLIQPSSPTSGAWSQNAAYFCSFAIDATMQGLGLAPLLMLDAQSKALEWNLKAINLKVVASAKGLLRFYERLGFKVDPLGDGHEFGFDLFGFTCELTILNTNKLLKAI